MFPELPGYIRAEATAVNAVYFSTSGYGPNLSVSPPEIVFPAGRVPVNIGVAWLGVVSGTP
jgi:hypothetical protein